MSYTVVVDEREREQRFENRLNVLYRHCRIGRVSRKMQILGGEMVAHPFFPPNPGSWPFQRRDWRATAHSHAKDLGRIRLKIGAKLVCEDPCIW